MIAFEATERSVDYLYIQDTMDGLGGFQALATFPDGTEKTITVTELDGDKNPDENDLPAFLGEMGVYAYEQQGNDYKLTTLVKANYNDDADTTTHDKVEAGERADYVNSLNSWELAPVNGGYDNGFSVNDTKTAFDDSLVGSDANANYQGKHASYSIRNGLNSIQVEYYDAADGVVDYTRSVVSLNNSTIFVDVEGGAVYTGYDAVPTMTDISFYVVYNRQLNADVVFITDGADNSTSDNFFFVLDENPISTKDASDGTVYREYAAMVNGEETTVVLKGINKDNAVIGADYIRENTLYRIVTITPNDEVTEVERVTDFTLVYSDTQNVPVDRTSGTLRIEGDVNISDSDNNIADNYTGERMYAYNSNDTIFVEVTLDEHGDVVDVDRSSAGAINTTNDDRAGHSNVFVLAVDDTDSRMPTATLVYIVNQDDDRFVTYNVNVTDNSANYSYSLAGVTNGQAYAGSNVTLTLTQDNAGYTPVVTVNGTAVNPTTPGGLTYSIPVTGNTNIVITDVVDTTVQVQLDVMPGARVVVDGTGYTKDDTLSLTAGHEVTVKVQWGGVAAEGRIVSYNDVALTDYSGTSEFYFTPAAADANKTLVVGVATRNLTLATDVNANWTYNGASGSITGDGTAQALPEGAVVTLTGDDADLGNYYTTTASAADCVPVTQTITMNSDVTVDAGYFRITAGTVTQNATSSGTTTATAAIAASSSEYVKATGSVTLTITLAGDALTGGTSGTGATASVDGGANATIASQSPVATAQLFAANAADGTTADLTITFTTIVDDATILVTLADVT